MATAIQMGLVPGFAMQDGDLLAGLLSGGGLGGGGLGLGHTVSDSFDISSSTQDSPTPAVSTVTVITVAGDASYFGLVDIPVCSILRVYNNSGNVIGVTTVDPTQQIDNEGAGQAVLLSANNRCDYLYIGDGNWISDLLGSPSA